MPGQQWAACPPKVLLWFTLKVIGVLKPQSLCWGENAYKCVGGFLDLRPLADCYPSLSGSPSSLWAMIRELGPPIPPQEANHGGAETIRANPPQEFQHLGRRGCPPHGSSPGVTKLVFALSA